MSICKIMKYLFLIVNLILGLALKASSQTSVYVIFTSTNSEAKGAWNNEGVLSENIIERRYFTLFDRASGDKNEAYLYDFTYARDTYGESSRVMTVNKSYLDDKVVIDWDLVTTKSDAEAKYNYITSKDNIIFIDRRDATSTKFMLYPVVQLKFGYY